MSMSDDPGSSEQETSPEEVQQPVRGEIDLRALADKLYRLLKEEARVERERLGRKQTW